MTTTGHDGAGRLHTDRVKAIPSEGTPSVLAAHDEIAHALQERSEGRWLVWFGHATGHYWAGRRPLSRYGRLVEATTADQLTAAMRQIDAINGGGS
jgi:hypothetical protein